MPKKLSNECSCQYNVTIVYDLHWLFVRQQGWLEHSLACTFVGRSARTVKSVTDEIHTFFGGSRNFDSKVTDVWGGWV